MQKEALTKGQVEDTGPNYDRIRLVVFGVVGFAALVVLFIVYKRFGGSGRRHRSSRGRRYRHDNDSVNYEGSFSFSELDSAYSQSYSDVVDQISKTVESFIDEQPTRVRKEIVAPAGKLGIIVDTSNDGPIIHSVNDDSPLLGRVFPGDHIIAVDGEDTSNWSAHHVTKLVALKSGSKRKLTLLSTNWDGMA